MMLTLTSHVNAKEGLVEKPAIVRFSSYFGYYNAARKLQRRRVYKLNLDSHSAFSFTLWIRRRVQNTSTQK